MDFQIREPQTQTLSSATCVCVLNKELNDSDFVSSSIK